ncbi:cytochrome c oxidase subunit 3 [Methylobacterium nigriterrae]|uniref:cytochrome c oxidase subunit 3 n=1 Tax=Methylobacterium nigriterrae TaxID=3127512 RepID=UPI0030141A0D
MSIVLVYLVILGSVAAWWLSRQRLASKPWLEAGPGLALQPAQPAVPAAKIGLIVLLAAIGLLFALLVAAYAMRVPPDSRQSLPDPRVLWFTSALLALASLALHAGRAAAIRRERDAVVLSLAAAIAATLGFLGGQALAWRQLLEAGTGSGDAAGAFFYLITALHGLHLGAGLLALAALTAQALRATGTEALRLPTELCAIYWDALLAIWLVLFGLLFRTPWSGLVYALCSPG